MLKTDELRSLRLGRLIAPQALLAQLPVSPAVAENVTTSRERIENILTGKDPRLLAIVGPCSIHDVDAALDYARLLATLRARYQDRLERVNFRSDPRWQLSGQSRSGIGARTTESQIHREMASALSCPVGFKNGTDGNLRIAIRAARASHLFLSPDKQGQMTIYQTHGNPYGHIILRGGKHPNYHAADIQAACELLREFALPSQLVVDFSHGNSYKQYQRQMDVCADVCQQIRSGSRAIAGVMLESFLVEGQQPLAAPQTLVYGKSITDGCLGWKETETLLAQLADAVDSRF